MIFYRTSRDLNIVERDGVIRELLVIFVPLARDQNNVVRPCQFNGAINGPSPIDNFFIMSRSESLFDLGDDRVRILFARIIRGNDGVISMAIHYFGHQRTFLPVAIATTTENRNQPMRLKLAQGLEHIPQGVGGMRVVYENLKLSLRWNQFQASRYLRRLAKTKHSVTQINPQSIGGSQRRYGGCNIKPTNQRHADQVTFAASDQLTRSADGLNA